MAHVLRSFRLKFNRAHFAGFLKEGPRIFFFTSSRGYTRLVSIQRRPTLIAPL